MERCSVVLLLGPPASGKTTLGEKLGRRFGYTLFDVGTHMREHMPPEADADAFAMYAVGQVLENTPTRKVILSGFPKWINGLDHLKSCRAKIVMVILLSPVLSFGLSEHDADTLSLRAAARHLVGERPEDDAANFRTRLETYEENIKSLLSELRTMQVPPYVVNPMDTPGKVEEAAARLWRIHLSPDNEEAPRGRSTVRVPGSTKDAQERRDPSEAEIEVSLCLPSGNELLRPWVTARSTVGDLRKELITAGETEFDLDFLHMGQALSDLDVISQFNGFESGSMITVVRKEKPPPPPRPRSASSSRYYRCFTPDSVLRVFENGDEVQRCFKHVKVGDMVRTGPGQGFGFFRRVKRVWKHIPAQFDEPLAAYELAEGCRITVGHPALVNGIWRRPESICKDIASFETVVYQLEIEGHVDTVLVGKSVGIVCALLGCYCGEDFGWNIFTRKTVRCDKQPCKKCAKACLRGLTFEHTKLTKQMVEAQYEPY